MSENNVDELMLSVQEATETLLMSQSSVYSWIERGKLKTQELPSGKVIVISRNEAEKIREGNLKSKRNRVSKQYVQNSGNFQESQILEAEISENCEENLTIGEPNIDHIGMRASAESIELAKFISELSAKAGKYELLDDLQKQNQENIEYWQKEYFRLQAENAELKAKLAVYEDKEKRRGLLSFLRAK